MSAYEICECKILELRGTLHERRENSYHPTALGVGDCLTCGQKWLFNHILQAWAKCWSDLGRAWLAGYPTVEDHEKAIAHA